MPTGCSVQEYDQLRDERTVELASGKTRGKRPDMVHVEQVAGYLSKSGGRYAVLCSDEQYFPIKLEGTDRQGRPTLQIAAPIQHNSLDPSVITAVAFVVHLALQNPPPLPPGNPAVAPPSGGGPSTRGQRRPKAKSSISQQPVVLSADELSMGLSLGWGASGVVLAGQLADVPLAIKVWELRSNAPAPPEAWAAAQRAAMQREAAVYDRLAPLQGRHVPVAVACGTLITRAGDPLPFLAMERVEGGVPADQAAGSPGFTHEALAAAAVDAVAGLQALHALGVAHGDICGDNVLLTPDGRAMFIDFGHARLDADEAAMRDEDGQLAELLMSPSGTALEVDGGAAGSAPAADGRGQLEFVESSSRSLLLRSLPADDSGSERWAGGRAAEGAAEDPETAASPGEAPGGGGGPSNARGRNGGGTTRASALGDVRPLCRPLVLRGPHIPLLRRLPALPGLRRGPGTVVRAVH
ncbi:hypothetical protein HYH03_005756 [Edaphochlamys debaryana]|uniref:Protein kinase domain-containing protein n=1 Tax=Edaphochlamys debaryana TaxID=47281 RepID=A0A835Y6Q4_9CHLO|nr:hypothetical protein HYH03_005756 [Edaphochlamys debaryana]|eukprot:KAG2496154.1 hypothetical protein HYH03_005756 [Edaphochlamys debaryana]